MCFKIKSKNRGLATKFNDWLKNLATIQSRISANQKGPLAPEKRKRLKNYFKLMQAKILFSTVAKANGSEKAWKLCTWSERECMKVAEDREAPLIDWANRKTVISWRKYCSAK